MLLIAKQRIITHGAVCDSNGASELDEVASGDGRELREERDQVVDAVCDTEVGEEGRLDGREDEHGAVGSATSRGTLASRDSDSVVWRV